MCLGWGGVGWGATLTCVKWHFLCCPGGFSVTVPEERSQERDQEKGVSWSQNVGPGSSAYVAGREHSSKYRQLIQIKQWYIQACPVQAQYRPSTGPVQAQYMQNYGFHNHNLISTSSVCGWDVYLFFTQGSMWFSVGNSIWWFEVCWPKNSRHFDKIHGSALPTSRKRSVESQIWNNFCLHSKKATFICLFLVIFGNNDFIITPFSRASVATHRL